MTFLDASLTFSWKLFNSICAVGWTSIWSCILIRLFSLVFCWLLKHGSTFNSNRIAIPDKDYILNILHVNIYKVLVWDTVYSDYIPHSVHNISMLCLFCIWMFLLLNPLHPSSSPKSLPSCNHQSVLCIHESDLSLDCTVMKWCGLCLFLTCFN